MTLILTHQRSQYLNLNNRLLRTVFFEVRKPINFILIIQTFGLLGFPQPLYLENISMVTPRISLDMCSWWAQITSQSSTVLPSHSHTDVGGRRKPW